MHPGTRVDPERALAELEGMMRSGLGLRLLLHLLPPGTPRADARRARERVLQLGRQPCALLDRELGIERRRGDDRR